MAKSKNKSDQNDKNASHYKPNVIRAEPFKWINFPIFVIIWFVLFWFLVCPIVWSKVHTFYLNKKINEWPHKWPYYFWGVALGVFCIIMLILVAIWKIFSSKKHYIPKNDYDKVFLNPEYGDDKELLCSECMTWHIPGIKNCPENQNGKKCCNCGNPKESFAKCCEKTNIEDRIIQGPSYDVVLRPLQPESDMHPKRISRQSSDIAKRNSLRSIRSGNSNTSVVISLHEIGTKDLVCKKSKTIKKDELADIDIRMNREIKDDNNLTKKEEPVDIDIRMNREVEDDNSLIKKDSKTFRNKKPTNLQPVDVDLANRHSSIEFFGEKIPLKNKNETTNIETTVIIEKTTETSHQPTSATPKSGSISSLDSMDKKKFKQYLHLVEVNIPSTPDENDKIKTTIDDTDKPPMSPREIFFYDMIQAAEKSGSGNSPDSTHFEFYKKYEKKRPTSHILLASETNPEMDIHQPEDQATTENNENSNETKCKSDTPTEKTSSIKILRMVKKNTVEIEKIVPSDSSGSKNNYSLSQQTSVQDFNNLNKESVSQYFITDLKNGPRKSKRINSSVEKDSIVEENANKKCDDSTNTETIDDVFD